ncbi:MAG TPA: hypothetical protein DD622_04300 [Opitutae bacterium]|nr:hypothetical protein [Opitutae bacterium]|tara:strand:- start:1680 stop:2366 length:687 start_codon:yes stop_codon:yes gene_type:complete
MKIRIFTINPISGQRAFTLIELLTVIAIVGILAAILLPAIGGMRSRALETKKLSMYRQYAIANTMYAADNKGYTCPTKKNNVEHEDWRLFLQPYLVQEDKNIWKNRIDVMYIDPFFAEYDEDVEWDTGLGMNDRILLPDESKNNQVPDPNDTQDTVTRTKLAAVEFPSYRFLIGDSNGPTRIYNTSLLNTSRHDGKGMFVLFDGSVKLYTQDEAELSFSDPRKLKYGN